MFPDDATLLARGKYSTLSKEWREQVKHVQECCRLLQAKATLILSDCQEKPPVDGSHLELVEQCVVNLKNARERLTTLSIAMSEIEPDAWPK